MIYCCCRGSSCGRRTPARWRRSPGQVWACRPQSGWWDSRPPAWWWRWRCWRGPPSRYRSGSSVLTPSSPTQPSTDLPARSPSNQFSHICSWRMSLILGFFFVLSIITWSSHSKTVVQTVVHRHCPQHPDSHRHKEDQNQPGPRPSQNRHRGEHREQFAGDFRHKVPRAEGD